MNDTAPPEPDVIDAVLGIAPGSPLDRLRRERDKLRHYSQTSYRAALMPADPRNFPLPLRAALAATVAAAPLPRSALMVINKAVGFRVLRTVGSDKVLVGMIALAGLIAVCVGASLQVAMPNFAQVLGAGLNPRFAQWVTTYDAPEFQESASRARELVDEAAAHAGEHEVDESPLAERADVDRREPGA